MTAFYEDLDFLAEEAAELAAAEESAEAAISAWSTHRGRSNPAEPGQRAEVVAASSIRTGDVVLWKGEYATVRSTPRARTLSWMLTFESGAVRLVAGIDPGELFAVLI